MREITVRDFQAYVRPLEAVTSIKYFGKIMTALDDDCSAVVGNLWKARKIWERLLIILGRGGADPRVLEISSSWWCRPYYFGGEISG